MAMNSLSISTFDGPYTEDRYNKFFNPNVCHVCKQPSEDLITCNRCYMISYCSEEHEAMHRNTHSQICKAIGKTNIRRCNICYSANFCDDDQILFKKLHDKCCDELLQLLNINIAHINGHFEGILPEIKKSKFTKFPATAPFYDTFTFMKNYLPNYSVLPAYELTLDHSILRFHFSLEQLIFSDNASDPLTLYNALQESNLISRLWYRIKYVIHVIDVNKTDITSLETWHIFLHLYRKIRELYIVFINSLNFESSDLGFVCSTCKTYKQKLYIRSVSEPYHDFVRLDSYEKPNVIILFQIEWLFLDTWSKPLEAIIAQECPLLLTAISENTVQECIDKIQKQTGTTRNRLHRENKFRGYMPYRNYMTGGFYYRNTHFIMFS
ncbi:uncharacterized protein LOC116847541 [Odontomachus brunneus]|uniref:uncharacterized protein LOC116847541 n=1 Tax=Odontomachus brunneus TaxID=486640 RepID=UPI0013F1993E|nr:uncharacterized protein LOC116847541 [Odontomachus brunneus]